MLVPVLLQYVQTGHAQTTLRGGVSTSAPSISGIYAGQDPLKGKPETMPPNSRGVCAPPAAGWILLYQSETTCYYFAPFKVPLQGQVISPQEAGQYKWDRCSAHPWDSTLIICYGPPRSRQNVGGGPGLPNFRSPLPGPAGGVGYVAGTDPCRPTGNYNYCDNGPGARLPPGCNCGWGRGGRPSLSPVPIPPTPYSTSDRPCPKNSGKWEKGPVINYFSYLDSHSWNLDFVSDARYITVTGHGALGVGKIGRTPFPVSMVDAKFVAQDIHNIRMMPGNGSKGIRIAACESAQAKGASAPVPLAQQIADAYKSLYNEPITVEGYEGCIQFNKPGGLDSFPCKLFTSK